MKAVPDTVVILGAGRSGTKILRDVLCRFSGWGTWPCDEINYIWRYGNAREATDELTPNHARPDVVRYIRNQVRDIARKRDFDVVVEKTCANTLRVPFVNEVLPEAKFVHIVRDGRDVAVSAKKRWRGSVDLSYVLRKARYVPLADVPYYSLRFMKDRLHRLWSDENRVATWGPRFEGLQDVLRDHSLLEACALQWKCCVEKAAADLEKVAPERTYRIYYENFVQRPVESLAALGRFLGAPTGDHRDLAQMTDDVFAGSLGNWEEELSSEQIASLHSLIRPTLQTFGYVKD